MRFLEDVFSAIISKSWTCNNLMDEWMKKEAKMGYIRMMVWISEKIMFIFKNNNYKERYAISDLSLTMTDWLTIQPADRHKTIMRPHRKDILSIRKQTKKIHNYFFLPAASSCWILMAVSRHLLGNQIPVLWSLLWLEYGQGSGLRETWQLIWEKIGKLTINLGW